MGDVQIGVAEKCAGALAPRIVGHLAELGI